MMNHEIHLCQKLILMLLETLEEVNTKAEKEVKGRSKEKSKGQEKGKGKGKHKGKSKGKSKEKEIKPSEIGFDWRKSMLHMQKNIVF